MAITSRALVNESSVNPPSGYTSRTAFVHATEDGEMSFTTDIAEGSIPNASAATGFDALLTAVEAWFTSTQGPAIGLDATLTINANVTITSVEAVNTAATIYTTPVRVYRVSGKVEWEVA